MEPFSRGVLLQDWKWDGPASAYARGVRLELGVGVGAPNREGAALCFLEASRGGFPLFRFSALDASYAHRLGAAGNSRTRWL
jgi:hypothetical protein